MDKVTPDQMRKMLRQRFKDSGVPLEGTFEITGKCNLNCKMCYVHTQPNSYYTEKEKDGDWWICLIDHACNAGMMFALLTGGECLLHPDFRRIYLHLRKKGVFTSINTNGLLLTDETISFLEENPPFEIQVTIYGTDDDSYEKVTGARVFERIEDVIQRLKKSGLNFKVAVTPNNLVLGETERIIKYLKKNRIGYTLGEYVFTPYSEQDERRLSEKSVALEEKIQYLQVHCESKTTAIPLELLPQPGGNISEPVYGVKCGAGRYAFFCTWDGCIQPCGAFHNQKIVLHAPAEFIKIWKLIHLKTKQYMRPIECEGCVYRKVCFGCPTMRSGSIGNGHCDRSICDLTRRLVAAGVKKLDQPEPADPEHGI